MGENERFGLSASFDFSVSSQTQRSVNWVLDQLGAMEQAVNRTAQTINNSQFGGVFQQQAEAAASSTRTASRAVRQMTDSAAVARQRLRPLKDEFRAIRAATRNLNFGDLTNDRQFRRASEQARVYIRSIRDLEHQVEGTTAVEREFTETLKRQAVAIKTQIDLQKQQRDAAKAAERTGQFQALRKIGEVSLKPLYKQGEAATKVFQSFDDQMSELAAISGATGTELDSLREKSKQLGATTRYTSTEASAAGAALASSGFTVQEILTGLGPALNLASAGAIDLEESAGIASSTVRGMGLAVEELTHVTDVLAFTAAATNSNIQDTAVSFTYALPPAKTFGSNLEEVSAIIGGMSNSAIMADKAGTAMRAMFLRLADPPKKGKAAIEEFGLSLNDSQGNMLNIIEILDQISNKLQLDPSALSELSAISEDNTEALDALAVSQSRQIRALSGLFGTTAVSGAAAALSQIDEIKRLAVAAQAASTPTEELTTYFTQLKGLKLDPGKDLFAAIVEQAPSYTDAVNQVNQANLDLMEGHLRSLDPKQTAALNSYLTNVKGFALAPGDNLLTSLVAASPNANAAIAQVTSALDTLGIQLNREAGAAKTMALVMENNLAGSFRSLGSAFEAVQIGLIEPLAPLIRGVADAITKLLLFIANLPAPVRSAIAITAGLITVMSALALAIGFAGAAAFGFSQALATSNAAAIALSRSAIPLTGFFGDSMNALRNTNPIEGLARTWTRAFDDLGGAVRGNVGEAGEILTEFRSRTLQAVRAALLLSRSFLLSPLGLGISAFLILNTVVSQVVPGLNLLGVTLSAIAAPIGFVFGLIKGLAESILNIFGTSVKGVFAPIAPIIQSITDAITQATQTFGKFSDKGEAIGKLVGDVIVGTMRNVGTTITNIWDMTIEAIKRPLEPFANFVKSIGYMLVGYLAEHSPGTTWLIRHAWEYTVNFISGLFGRLQVLGKNLMEKFHQIAPLLHDSILPFVRLFAIFARLTSLIDPIHAILLSGATVIIQAIIELMDASFRDGIKVSLRAIASLIAIEGSIAVTKGLVTVGAYLKTVLGALIVSNLGQVVVDHFEVISAKVIKIWHDTFNFITNIVSNTANRFKAIGQRFVSFLAENSPGPTELIRNLWAFTVNFITKLFTNLVSVAQRAGIWLVEAFQPAIPLFTRLGAVLGAVFTAENIPGLVTLGVLFGLIIPKLIETSNWLKDLGQKALPYIQTAAAPVVWTFKTLRDVLVTLNEAFLGLGDVTVDERFEARQRILQGMVGAVLAVVNSLSALGHVFTLYSALEKRLIEGALENFDYLSFTLLTLSSLPMTLLGGLQEGFEKFIPELAIFAGHGIPRAILYSLPAAVAAATSTGLIKGFERGFSNALDTIPGFIKQTTDSFYNLFSPQLVTQINATVSEGVTELMRSLPNLFRDPELISFQFDFLGPQKAIHAFAEGPLTQFIAYLHKIGDVANEVGDRLYEILEPILTLSIGQVYSFLSFVPPIIPGLLVVEPLIYKAIPNLLQSPALAGIMAFFSSTVLPAALKTIRAIAAFLTYIVAIPFSPILIAIGGALQYVVSNVTRLIQILPVLARQFVFALGNFIADGVLAIVRSVTILIAKIPYIGQAIAQVFTVVSTFIVRNFPIYLGLLIKAFQPVIRQFRIVASAWRQVLVEIGKGIAYFIDNGLRPLGPILAKALDPRSAFKLIGFYLRTGGFKGIIKQGIINPFDLFFGGRIPFTKSLVQGFIFSRRLFQQAAFPFDIIEMKQREMFNILADPLQKARASRFKLLVKTADILDNVEKMGPGFRIILEVFRGLMLVSPWIQIVARFAMSLLFWYSILKPLNEEMFQAIGNTQIFGVRLTGLAVTLRVIRFTVIALTETLFFLSNYVPRAVVGTLWVFNRLSVVVGATVRELVAIFSIFANVFKATVINTLMLIPLAVVGALELSLIFLRQNLISLRAMAQRYGDAITQLFTGDMSQLGVIVGYLFEDIVVNILRNALWLAKNTLGRLLNLAVTAVRATVDEIYRLVTHPIDEIQRLIAVTSRFIERVVGAVAAKVWMYVELLQLDRFAKFLWSIKYAIAAVTPIVLYLLGVMNPMLFAASLVLEGVLGLIYEYKTGFKELDSLIQALQNPINALNNLLNTILATFNIYISPGVSQFIGNLAAGFVQFIPVIAAGIFLLTLLVKRNLGEAFATVTDTVVALRSAITGVGDSVKDAFERPKTQIFLKELSHNVRTRENVAGVRNPFKYSPDPEQQQYARSLRQQELGKAKAAMRYQKEIEKQVAKAQLEETKTLKGYYKSNLASERRIAQGGSFFNPETGQNFVYAPRVEEKRDRLGRKKLELTESGKAYVEQEARRNLLKGTNDTSKEMRQDAARRAGLEFQFKEYGGGELPPRYDDALRELAQPGDQPISRLLNTFQEAMENIHVKEFRANGLYIDNYRIPPGIPTDMPLNTVAFDMQLDKLKKNLPQGLTPDQRQQIERVDPADITTNALKLERGKSGDDRFKSVLEKVGIPFNFAHTQSATFQDFIDRQSGLLKSAAGNETRFEAQLQKTTDELIQIQTKYLSGMVGSFSDFREANTEVVRQGKAFREVPVATGFDAITQGVRNIADQAQAGANQLGDDVNVARKSLPAILFGFTGIPQILEQIKYNRELERRVRQVTGRTQLLVENDLKNLQQERRRRERGLRNLIANMDGNLSYDDRGSAGGFYDIKKLSEQQQKFLEDFLTGERSLNQLVRTITDKEDQQIKTAAGAIKLTGSANPMQDLYKSLHNLTNISEEERVKYRKMLGQFMRYGAQNKTVSPGSKAISEAEYTELKRVLDLGFTNVLGKQGAGNLTNFYNTLSPENRKLVAQYVETGKELIKISDEEKKELAKSLGISISQLKRLSPQTIPLKNFFEAIRQSVDFALEDYRDTLVSFGLSIRGGTQKVESRLKAFLPSELVDPLFDRIYRFYDDFGRAFMKRYDTAREGLQKGAEGFIKSVKDSRLITAFRSADEEYRKASKFSLQNLMEEGKPAEYVTKQEDVNGRMVNVRRNIGGAKDRGELQTRVIKELKSQGFSQKEANQAMLAILERGTEGRMTIGERLKKRTDQMGRVVQKDLDADKVASAFAKALMVPVDKIKSDIMNNPEYSARAARPFHWFLLKEFPAIALGTVTGVTTLVQRAARTAVGQTVGRIAKAIVRDISLGLGSPILKGLSRTSLVIGGVLSKGFNALAEGAFNIIGPNPFSHVLNNLSDFFLNTGRRTASYFSKTQTEIGKSFSLTGTIVGFISNTFKTVAKSFGDIYQEAQRTGWLNAIRQAFGGIGRFFRSLLPPKQGPLQEEIGIARGRIVASERSQAARQRPDFQEQFTRETQKRLNVESQHLQQLKQERDRLAKIPTIGPSAPEVKSLDALITKMEGRVKGLQNLQQSPLLSPELEQQNLDKLIADQRRIVRQQNPVLRIFDAITDQIKRSPNRALKGLGSIFEKIAAKLPTQAEFKEFVRKQRVRQTPSAFVAGSDASSAAAAQAQQTGFSLETSIKRTIPLFENVYKTLTSRASLAAFSIAQYFNNAAKRTETAWEESANHITGKSWFAMVHRAIWTGVKIVTNLNHGAADVTAEAWDRTEKSTQENMKHMADNAEKAGGQIKSTMNDAAQTAGRSAGLLGRIGQSIGGVGKAGMAIGGAVTATGFGLQTLTYSLSTMGFVSEETSQQLQKFFEIFTILGAVGGIVTPILAAIGTSLGAIGTLAGTAITGVTALGGVIAPLIGLGEVAFAPFLVGIALVVAAAGALYFAFRTNFLGIRDLAGAVGSAITSTLSGPIDVIERFWLAFVERFKPILQPVVDIAQKVGSGIVGFLNHGSADVTAEAWQRTEKSATQNMEQMGLSAAQASAQISSNIEQSTEHSQGFIERLKENFSGIGSLIAAAGAATGGAIAGFFSPVTNLFNRKEAPVAPEVAPPVVPPVAPEAEKAQGFNPFKIITAPIALVQSAIQKTVELVAKPINWLAEAIMPLQRAVALIAGFFENLVTIVQSVAYLHYMIGPLSSQGEAINGTIRSIAKFLYNIRSIVESLEFLHSKISNLFGWGRKADTPETPAKKIGKSAPDMSGSPGYYEPDAPKPPKTRIQEILGLKKEVTEIVGNVKTLKEAAPEVAGAFGGAMNKIGSTWQHTVGSIGQNTETLVETSQDHGYEIQKALSEGSPGLTSWIRDRWEFTTGFIKDRIGGVASATESEMATVRTTTAEGLNQITKEAQATEKSFSFFGMLGGIILAPFKLVWGIVSGLAKLTFSILGGIFKLAVGTLSVVATVVLLPFKLAWNVISGLAKLVFSVLAGIIGFVTTALSAVISVVSAPFKLAWAAISGLAQSAIFALNGIVGTATTALSTVAAVIVAPFTLAWAAISGLTTATSDSVKTLAAGPVATLKGIGKTILSPFKVLGKTLLAIPKNAVKTVKKVGNVLVSPIKALVATAVLPVKAIGDALVGAKNAVVETLDAIVPSFIPRPGKIIQAVDSVVLDITDRYQFLERNGVDDVGALFEPGVEDIGTHLEILAWDIFDFTKRSAIAIATLNVNDLVDAFVDLGGNFAWAAKGIIAGFGSMTTSAISFAVFAFASIAPFLLTLGAVAFTAAVIFANFLGLRTVLFGTFRVGIGIVQIFLSVLKGVIQTVGAVKDIVVGTIRGILTGDFTQLRKGLGSLKDAFVEMGLGVLRGFGTISKGLQQILNGIFEGIGQVFNFIGKRIPTVGRLLDNLWNRFTKLLPVFKDGEKAGALFADVLIRGIKGVVQAVGAIPGYAQQAFTRLKNIVKSVVQTASRQVRDFIGSLKKLDFSEIFKKIRREVTVVAGQIRDKLFEISKWAITATEDVAPGLLAPFRYIRDFIRGFMGRVFQELPPELLEKFKTSWNNVKERFLTPIRSLFNPKLPLFPQLLGGLKTLSDRFSKTVNRMGGFWGNLQKALANPDLFSGFFNGLRKLGDRFVQTLQWIEQKWSDLKLPGLPVVQKITTQLTGFKTRFDGFVDYLQDKWGALARWLSKTPLFGKALAQMEKVGNKMSAVMHGGTERYNRVSSLKQQIGEVQSRRDRASAIATTGSDNFSRMQGALGVEQADKELLALNNQLAEIGQHPIIKTFDQISVALPKSFKEVNASFQSTVTNMERGWGSLVKWLNATSLFSNFFSLLQQAGLAFVRFTRKLTTRWDNFQKYLTDNNPLIGVFNALREGTRRFILPFIWLENKWKDLKLPGAKIIEGVFDPVFKARYIVDSFFDSLERKWLGLSTFLSSTNLVGSILLGFERLGQTFLMVVRKVRTGWKPFLTFLSTGEIFPQIFKALHNLPKTFKDAASKIKSAWEGFVEKFKIIMKPVADFAEWVAQKIIKALNCHATDVVPNAWERAVTRIKEIFNSLVAPVRGVAKLIIGAFKQVSDFIVGFAQAFYDAVFPVFERVDKLLGQIRKGTLSASNLGNVSGINDAWSRLLKTLKPLVDGVRNFVDGLTQTNKSTQKATSTTQKLGRVLGKALGHVLDFALKGAPPLLKVLGIIVQIGLELAIFGFKVAYAMRVGVVSFIRLGLAVYEGIKNVTSLIGKVLKARAKIGKAFDELKANFQKFKDKLLSGFNDLKVALKGLAVAVLDVFAPNLKNRIKNALSSLGFYTNYIRTALKDLVSESIAAYRRLGKTIASFSPFKALADGAKTARDLIAGVLSFIDSGFRSLGLDVYFIQVSRSINNAFDAVRKRFGLLSDDAKTTGEMAAANVTSSFNKVAQTIRESIHNAVNYYLAAFNDIRNTISSFIAFYVAAFVDLKNTLISTAPVKYLISQFESLRQVAIGVLDNIKAALGLVIGKIGELAIALGLDRHFEAIKNQIKSIAGTINSTVNTVTEEISARFQSVVEDLNNRFILLKAALSNGFESIADFIKSTFGNLGAAIQGTLTGIQDAMTRIAEPYKPILTALGDVLAAVGKIAKAFIDLIADITVFGVKIDETITGIVMGLGRVLFSVAEITSEIFMEGGIIRMVKTFMEISSAVKDLALSLSNLLIDAIPPLARLRDAIIESLEAPLKKIAALWETTGGKVVGTIQRMTGKAKGEGQVIEQVVGEQPAKNTAQAWEASTEKVTSDIQATTVKAKAQGEVIEQVIGELPAQKTRRFWNRATKAVTEDIQATVEKAGPQGYELQRDISEGSPGPTYWIRHHWKRTVESIDAGLSEMGSIAKAQGKAIAAAINGPVNSITPTGINKTSAAIHNLSADLKLLGLSQTPTSLKDIKAAYRQQANVYHPDKGGDASQFQSLNDAYQRVKTQFENPVTAQVNTQVDAATSTGKRKSPVQEAQKTSEEIELLNERMQNLGQTSRQSLMSVGSVLSNFAPQLATPLFALNDFVDAFFDLRELLPQIKSLFAANAATTVASDAAIATSEAVKAGAAQSSAIVQVTSSIQVGAAKTTEATVVGSSNTFMAGTYRMLASAARMAYTSMIKPLMAILPWIALAVAAVFVLYQAFKNNFLGIRTLVEGVVDGFKFFFNTLFSQAWAEIASVFTTLESAVKSVMQTISEVADFILKPFQPLLDFLGFGQGYQYKSSGASVILGLVNLILAPLKLVTNILKVIINLTAFVLKPMIWLVGGVISLLLLPLTGVALLVTGLLKGFAKLGEWVGYIFNKVIAQPILWVLEILQRVVNYVGGAFQKLKNWLLAPFIALGNFLKPIFSAIKAFLDFVVPPILAIAAIISALFLLLSAGLPGIIAFFAIIAVVTIPLLLVALGLVVFAVNAMIVAVMGALTAGFTFIVGTLVPTLISAVVTGLSIIVTTVIPIIVSAFSFLITTIIPLAISSVIAIGTTLMGVIIPALAAVFSAMIPILFTLAPFILGALAIVAAVILIKFAFEGIVKLFKWLWNGFLAFLPTIISIGKAVGGFLLAPFKLIWQYIQWIGNGIRNFLSGIPLIGGLFKAKPQPAEVQAFAGGGPINGPGTSTGDRVLIAASPNEYVVNAASTAANYGLLEAVNAGAVFTPVTAAPPTPAAVPPASVSVITVADSDKSELPPMTVNISFGDIILQSATGVEAAKEFFDNVEPMLQRKMREMLRDLVEKTK